MKRRTYKSYKRKGIRHILVPDASPLNEQPLVTVIYATGARPGDVIHILGVTFTVESTDLQIEPLEGES